MSLPISLAPMNGCQADCAASIASSVWFWSEVSYLSSIVHATVVYITNDDDGRVRSTTVYNDLPAGVTAPSTNAAGTQTAIVTIETAQQEFTTIELAYPTAVGKSGIRYLWDGVLPTYDVMSNPVCSTVPFPGAPVYLNDYTADITTKTASMTTDPADPAGLFYTLQKYACPDGRPLETPPPGNSWDGALLSCDKPSIACGATAVKSVKLLTETSNSRESSARSQPTPNIAPAEQVPQSSRREPTPAASNAAPSVQDPAPGTQETQSAQEDMSVATPVVSTQVSTVAPTNSVTSDTPPAVTTGQSQGLSSVHLGDIIASGVGEASPTANVSSRAEQFQGAATGPIVPMWLMILAIWLALHLRA